MPELNGGSVNRPFDARPLRTFGCARNR